MNKQVMSAFMIKLSTKGKLLAASSLLLILAILLSGCGFSTPTVPAQTPLITPPGPAVSSTPAPAYSTPAPVNPTATPVPTP